MERIERTPERAAAYVDPVTGESGLTYAELQANIAAREEEE